MSELSQHRVPRYNRCIIFACGCRGIPNFWHKGVLFISNCLNAVLANFKYFRFACLGLLNLVNVELRPKLLGNIKFLLAILSFYSDDAKENPQSLLTNEEIVEYFDIIIIREHKLHNLIYNIIESENNKVP